MRNRKNNKNNLNNRQNEIKETSSSSELQDEATFSQIIPIEIFIHIAQFLVTKERKSLLVCSKEFYNACREAKPFLQFIVLSKFHKLSDEAKKYLLFYVFPKNKLNSFRKNEVLTKFNSDFPIWIKTLTSQELKLINQKAYGICNEIVKEVQNMNNRKPIYDCMKFILQRSVIAVATGFMMVVSVSHLCFGGQEGNIIINLLIAFTLIPFFVLPLIRDRAVSYDRNKNKLIENLKKVGEFFRENEVEEDQNNRQGTTVYRPA